MTGEKLEFTEKPKGLLDAVILFCLENKLIVFLGLLLVVGWGLMTAPFDWELGGIPRDPVPVDAIPDIGENQQIVFTRWPGRSPRDVEDQITYPLTAALMGIPGLKTVRSFSYFGFSSIYLIFKDDVDFYWSRSRVLEKLNSLPPNTLPMGVQPALGPDATALGQIFWYTLEGRDKNNKPAPGWNTYELRTIQDWYVRYALQSAEGVSEVASIGGFVSEYQIDVDPDKLRIYNISLQELYRAVKRSNREIGARTIEINSVEYVIRARGYIKKIEDIENTVIKAHRGTPIYIKNVATVTRGPGPRRGALDKDGAEVVGGVVVARYGANPLMVIKNVKKKIRQISPGLPSKTLPDGRISKVTIVPFYDRTDLIYETLYTLEEAITLEILVTIVVVLVMLMHLRSSLLISGTLPVAVLMCFIGMKLFKIDANIVALSGIAIAIGTMVDMGVVLSENIVHYLARKRPDESALEIVFRATSEVGSAILTAVATTVISFLPVFTMEAAEGKLFRPLAYTKTFALIASLIVSLFILPPLAHLFFKPEPSEEELAKRRFNRYKLFISSVLFIGGIILYFYSWKLVGPILSAIGIYRLLHQLLPAKIWLWLTRLSNLFAISIAIAFLTAKWRPLGYERSFVENLTLVALTVGSLLGFFAIFQRLYGPMLKFFLRHKFLFLIIPTATVLFGAVIWLGFDRVFGWIPQNVGKIERIIAGSSDGGGSKDAKNPQEEKGLTSAEKWIRSTELWASLSHAFPGLKKEFMPDLDEGAFLLMPTIMPHASIGEALDYLSKIDRALRAIPEVYMVVGKLGRVESALDPAPISMFENIILYKPKYKTLPDGRKVRQWRPHIKTVKDVWNEIVKASKFIGLTSAPFLQPIAARIVMLQSGMRAPMGVKIKGPDLKTIEKVALEIEKYLKEVPQVEPATVTADRVIGKPYLEFTIDRQAIARYGLQLSQVQDVIQMAIGGKVVTTTIEGRERYPVVVRYYRELRTDIEELKRIMLTTADKSQIPLMQVAKIEYVRGPQVIKSEDTFLVAYVVFDRKKSYSEVETVEAADRYLQMKIESGEFKLPPGVSYEFAGSYENQVRAEKKLSIVLPLALTIIFFILYLQFRSTWVTSFIFSGILVAWAGGFIMLWLYSQPWFLDFSIFGANLREIFLIRSFNMSVAIWVGFIALFGIASDNGVVICTYLDQLMAERKPKTREEIRQIALEAGVRRIRPCLMTTATTLLALLPVLTSSGRGSDIMIPMAIPSFGGMMVQLITLFVVPVLYSWRAEIALKRQLSKRQ